MIRKSCGLHGQGSTEYLVVLGVVLAISLVSISLLGYFPGTAGESHEAASKIYWQGDAKPLRVNDAVLTQDSEFTFDIENAVADPITLTNVVIDGTPAEFSEENNFTNSSSVYFGPGEKKLVKIGNFGSFNCAAGRTSDFTLAFGYQSMYGTTRTQVGDKPFVIRCSMDSGQNVVQNQTQNLTQNLSSCGITFEVGKTYALESDVSSNGTCYSIAAENVTLNCGGHAVVGSGSGDGVSLGANHVTVKNCMISNFARGIYGIDKNYLIVQSNTISLPSEGSGIYLVGNIVNSQISSNSITGSGVGIWISGNGAGTTDVAISSNHVNTAIPSNVFAGFNNYIGSLGARSSISGNTVSVSTSRATCSLYALQTASLTGSSIQGNQVTITGPGGCAGNDGSNSQTTISGNTYVTNTNCVGFYQPGGCINCQISGNSFRGEPGLGGQMSGTYTGTTISGNTFKGGNIGALVLWNGINRATFTGNTFENSPGDLGWAFGTYSNGLSYNNVFTGNTFRTYAPANPAIYLNAQSYNNSFYQNTIQGNSWVSNANAGNVFSTSSAGNSYYMADGTPAGSFLNMTDDNGDGWADSGSSVPFSSATIPTYWSGVGSDAHPHID